MSMKTTLTQISERDLADHLTEILDRVAKGERIVVRRGTSEIAIIEPIPSNSRWTWGELLQFLNESPFDEEFARIVREVHDSQPSARHAEWSE